MIDIKKELEKISSSVISRHYGIIESEIDKVINDTGCNPEDISLVIYEQFKYEINVKKSTFKIEYTYVT
jgi:hypothetical protein